MGIEGDGFQLCCDECEEYLKGGWGEFGQNFSDREKMIDKAESIGWIETEEGEWICRKCVAKKVRKGEDYEKILGNRKKV